MRAPICPISSLSADPVFLTTPWWANYRSDDTVPFLSDFVRAFDEELLPGQVAYVTAHVDR